MKRIIFLFVFLLVLANVNAKLNSVEQQHTTESYNKRVALFEKLSSLLSSLIQNNNADFGAKVVSFRKLTNLLSINQTHNSTSNGLIINVTFNASAEVCYSGTLNIVTSTDGLNIKVNNIYEGQTDYSYFIQKEITLANCQSSYDVDVYCHDNATLCYSETAYIPSNGETATVIEPDCVKTCSTDANLWLTNKDAKISGNNINVTIHSSNVNGNVDISMYRINEATGLVDDVKVLQTNIDSYSASSVAAEWDLSSASALNVYIDESGEFDENKDDNFVYRVIAQNVPKAYLSINTSYPAVDSLIENYLRQYIDYEENINNAELIISVGKFTKEFKIANPETLKPNGLFWWKTLGWGYKDNRINAYGKTDSSSYAGIIGRTAYNGKPLILSYGNRLDGDIASVKKLISARELMFSDFSNPEKPPILIDKYDKLALGINNLLRGFTDYSSPQFLSVVNKILFDNAYDVAIRTVKTLDTTSYGESTILRLKNVNSDYSDDFKDAISENDRPVVFSGGIFSDLFRWEEDNGLALQLAQDGRDVWEIEITGGPTIDADCKPEGKYNCPNYEYEDLVDYYWPALIGGIERYSGNSIIQYVGHSNGCRVALNSLEKYSSSGKSNAGYYFDMDTGQYLLTGLASEPVDTFVGLGCPGAFNGTSALINDVNNNPNSVLRLKNKGITHPDRRDIGREINFFGRLVKEGNPISLNVWSKYTDFILSNNNDDQPGQKVSTNKLYLIYGIGGLNAIGDEQDDGMVTANDQWSIANNVQSSNTDKTLQYKKSHGNLPDDKSIKNKIKVLLGGE